MVLRNLSSTVSKRWAAYSLVALGALRSGDSTHFFVSSIIRILNLMIGLTTPPVGMCICTGAQIGGVSSWKAFKANMPFLITSLIVLMLVSFCEPITLWIPSLFA